MSVVSGETALHLWQCSAVEGVQKGSCRIREKRYRETLEKIGVGLRMSGEIPLILMIDDV